jgi:hypothetical protein
VRYIKIPGDDHSLVDNNSRRQMLIALGEFLARTREVATASATAGRQTTALCSLSRLLHQCEARRSGEPRSQLPARLTPLPLWGEGQEWGAVER